MCAITLTGESNDRYDYKSCQDNIGYADINFVEQIGEFQKYSVTGEDTQGDPFDEEVTVPNEETVSPSKLFKYIADTIKSVLCPECV